MPDKILINSITVNGRTLRAEPPVEVKPGKLAPDCFELFSEFGGVVGTDPETLLDGLKFMIASKYVAAEAEFDRYRQRFKEAGDAG